MRTGYLRVKKTDEGKVSYDYEVVKILGVGRDKVSIGYDNFLMKEKYLIERDGVVSEVWGTEVFICEE